MHGIVCTHCWYKKRIQFKTSRKECGGRRGASQWEEVGHHTSDVRACCCCVGIVVGADEKPDQQTKERDKLRRHVVRVRREESSVGCTIKIPCRVVFHEDCHQPLLNPAATDVIRGPERPRFCNEQRQESNENVHRDECPDEGFPVELLIASLSMDDTFDGECIAGAKHHGGQRAVAQHLPLRPPPSVCALAEPKKAYWLYWP